VAEAAVSWAGPDALKGQALVAFVTCKGGVKAGRRLREELRSHVAKEIGPVAKPDDYSFRRDAAEDVVRENHARLLKQIAEGGDIKGDTTTLEDFQCACQLAKLRIMGIE